MLYMPYSTWYPHSDSPLYGIHVLSQQRTARATPQPSPDMGILVILAILIFSSQLPYQSSSNTTINITLVYVMKTWDVACVASLNWLNIDFSTCCRGFRDR